MQHNSRFIAIEGLDGAGKSTQIALLTEYFNKQGIETRFVHFPIVQEGVFGELVAKFLRGDFGDVKNVHPQLVALLFAEDRRAFAHHLNEWLASGYVVLVDRYVLSNIAFQCAKLHTEKEKKELREWINMFEYEYNRIPQPDLSVYLDVPFSFTEKALTERRSGEDRKYLNGKDDIHEKDFSLQLAVKQEYEVLADTDPSVTKIICYDGDGKMKSVEEIHAAIIHNITK
ncbi:dTMP kinase [Chitinophaga ginsengisoli]|uniref:Thymidylate kinase n=1 Tax=Chitinophaga ginsengisoli TaxID=363837 RepID=A0A2P8GN88_9BACT|nr:dTMP kinase [Chitinophaga ginsengisoli]PSL35431.1 dTMP kinase [Chitinophaga ginsengisoli]